jgi:hypothetical protein
MVGMFGRYATAKQRNLCYRFQMLSYSILSFRFGGDKSTAELTDKFQELDLVVKDVR